MGRTIGQDEHDSRWAGFAARTHPDGARVAADGSSVELGCWLIRPSGTRLGWWHISEVSESGSWATNLPWEAADMLWSGIESHWASEGDAPLYIDQGSGAITARVK